MKLMRLAKKVVYLGLVLLVLGGAGYLLKDKVPDLHLKDRITVADAQAVAQTETMVAGPQPATQATAPAVTIPPFQGEVPLSEAERQAVVKALAGKLVDYHDKNAGEVVKMYAVKAEDIRDVRKIMVAITGKPLYKANFRGMFWVRLDDAYKAPTKDIMLGSMNDARFYTTLEVQEGDWISPWSLTKCCLSSAFA